MENEIRFSIYIVRHGETEYNVSGHMQGSCDSPLTKRGLRQCCAAGIKLSHIQFDAVYCSDLERHKQTTSIIMNHNKNKIPSIVCLPGLREWDFGGFENKPNQEVWSFVADYFQVDFNNLEDDYKKLMQCAGGLSGLANTIAKCDPHGIAEDYSQILCRTQQALQRIFDEAKDIEAKNILIVSSGIQIRTILELLMPECPITKNIPNCSIAVLDYLGSHYYLRSMKIS